MLPILAQVHRRAYTAQQNKLELRNPIGAIKQF